MRKAKLVAVSCIPMDVFGEGTAAGSLALPLVAASRRNRLHRFSAEQWEVEVRNGSEHIVARTTKGMSPAALLDEGIEIAHRGLDLSSVEDFDHLVTRSPADEHIILQRNGGLTTVRLNLLCDLRFEALGQLEIRRADGTIDRPQRPADPAWTPAFRFQRLANSSRDLFEAYRNMFLALEALLDERWPKAPRESEKNWLLRAVTAAGATLTSAGAGASSARDQSDLVNHLYNVRVHLFHAKTGRTFIPDERVSYTKVADAYSLLVSLWRDIARRTVGLGPRGGGMTHYGFRQTVGTLLRSLKIAVTADDTPFAVTETEASPKGMRVSVLPEPTEITDERPGRMALIGRGAVSALAPDQVIGRVIALSDDEKPAIVGNIPGGLALNGADLFEAATVVRLINLRQPTMNFS